MFNVILGLFLILIPFLLTFCFTDRRRGFLYILSSLIGFHLLVALITQSLHIFSYPLILGINIFISLVCIFIFIKYKKNNSKKIEINWLAILAFLIIFFELWSVHYFYSGQVGTTGGKLEVERASYSYPYFSDEWVGVALVNYSLDSHALSSGNPLVSPGTYSDFPNTLVAWFALISELFLLTNLSPLTGYAIFALVTGALACLLVYLSLRSFGLKNYTATLAALTIPFITNGQNLPGIWYLLPFIGALLLFLITLTALSDSDWKLFFISSLLALIIYPPIIIFILTTLLITILLNKKINLSSKFKLFSLSFLTFLIAAIAIIILQKYNLNNLVAIAKSSLFYPALDSGIVSFLPWNIIPALIWPLAIFGIFIISRKKLFWLLTPLITGLIFWLIYSHSTYFFIISYERTVIVTSFLIIIAAAFGFDKIINLILNKFPYFTNRKITLIIEVVSLIIFACLAWGYTGRSNWQNLTLNLTTPDGEERLTPTPPASEYLTSDDLTLFTSIKKKNFLSVPWKALAVGAATINYPLESKPSFITNRKLSYSIFMAQSCADKNSLALEHRLSYVYSSAFTCPNFSEIGVSQEDLHLYKFNR